MNNVWVYHRQRGKVVETQVFTEPNKVSYSYRTINSTGQLIPFDTTHLLRNKDGKILELATDVDWEKNYG